MFFSNEASAEQAHRVDKNTLFQIFALFDFKKAHVDVDAHC